MAMRSSAVVVVVPHTPLVAGTVWVISRGLLEGPDGTEADLDPQLVGRAVEAVFDHWDGE